MSDKGMQRNTMPADRIPMRVARIALLVPWILWLAGFTTGIFALGPLGFLALLPSAITAFILTSRRVLKLPESEPYPAQCDVLRVIAALYFLPLIPFLLILLMRASE